MPFGWIERHAQAAFFDASLCDERGELRINAEPRILEIDRVDRVLRDGHLDPRRTDHALARKCDEPCEPPTWPPLVHAIEIDEVDGLVRPVRVHHAGAQATGHEGQMRVGVAWLYGALRRIEVAATFEPIVLVAGAFRKERSDSVNVGRNVLLFESRRQTAVEKSRRRVERPVQAVPVIGQSVVFGCELGAQIDDVESRLRSDLESDVERFCRHRHSTVTQPDVRPPSTLRLGALHYPAYDGVAHINELRGAAAARRAAECVGMLRSSIN